MRRPEAVAQQSQLAQYQRAGQVESCVGPGVLAAPPHWLRLLLPLPTLLCFAPAGLLPRDPERQRQTHTSINQPRIHQLIIDVRMRGRVA